MYKELKRIDHDFGPMKNKENVEQDIMMSRITFMAGPLKQMGGKKRVCA